ncbi:hypothetical protein BaRGS_00022720 [Batillaria attramentaria]|uniref:Uncharacterized protein n=1 Tax=Batillaria attramentaria TaxID=370345 RepID=A0ABD0KGK7_9CAEN
MAPVLQVLIESRRPRPASRHGPTTTGEPSATGQTSRALFTHLAGELSPAAFSQGVAPRGAQPNVLWVIFLPPGTSGAPASPTPLYPDEK